MRARFLLNLISLLLFSALIILVVDINLTRPEVYLLFYFFVVIFSLPAYLITSLYLIPAFVYQQKFKLLVAGIILTLIVCSFTCIILSTYLVSAFYPEVQFCLAFPYLLGSEFLDTFQDLWILFAWNTFLGMFTNAAITVFYDKQKIDAQMHELQERKIEAELAYLKNQLKPEFLFSVMQTLKEETRNENQEVRDSIEVFSNLLYFQIYECGHDLIDLEKDLSYVRNYITVQSKRMDNVVQVRLNIGGNLHGIRIIPLVIMPLVENAFKHISGYDEINNPEIVINVFKEEDNTLKIFVQNPCIQCSGYQKAKETNKGVGLKNLKRRLDLLYPDKHRFITDIKDGLFSVEIKLQVW